MSRTTLALKPFDHAKAAQNKQAWTAIAERVIKGDYNKADGSTRTSLTIGLRGYTDDICQRAVEILKKYER